MIKEEQRRALILKNNDRREIRVNNLYERETQDSEKKQWQPIVGIDNSYFEHKPKRVQDKPPQQALLQYYKGFDAKAINDRAATILKLHFNTSIDFIKQFALRTKVYVLRT